MHGSGLARLAQSIRESREPLAKGREILLEEYRKTAGICETRVPVAAGFEVIRSLVVQTLYETMKGGTGSMAWLEAGCVEPEIEGAKALRARFLGEGFGQTLKRHLSDVAPDPYTMLRIEAENDAIGHTRFLGSVRQYLPGVGYGVSVRKRSGENQDSFILSDGGREEILAVADGCGSQRFSAIASHLAVREILRSGKSGMTRKSVCEMSRYIAWLLNDTGLLKTNGGSVENGTTTLVAALVEDGRSRVLKVGDSLALRTYTSGGQGVAEVLSESFELRYALGQQNAPGDNAVESFEREGGRLVLVSDGVFNYLTDPVADIARWSMLSGDAVFIAEKVVRSVLRNQAQWGYADDVTIVVQDTGR